MHSSYHETRFPMSSRSTKSQLLGTSYPPSPVLLQTHLIIRWPSLHKTGTMAAASNSSLPRLGPLSYNKFFRKLSSSFGCRQYGWTYNKVQTHASRTNIHPCSPIKQFCKVKGGVLSRRTNNAQMHSSYHETRFPMSSRSTKSQLSGTSSPPSPVLL